MNPRLWGGVSAGILLSLAIPIAIAAGPSWTHRGSVGPLSEPFEFFGMCVTAMLAIIAFCYRQRWAELDRDRRLVVLAFGVFILAALAVIVNTGERSWDYRCYENAAIAIVEGRTPYGDACYLYPPLLAQLLAGTHQFLQWIDPEPSTSYNTWWLVFFCYQAVQFYLIVLAGYVCLRLGERVLGPGSGVVLAVLALLAVASPIHRSFRFQQANLLSLIAVAYLYLDLTRNQLSRGAVVAAACLVKPLLILAPLSFIARRTWRVMAGFVLAGVSLTLVSHLADPGRQLYAEFVQSIQPVTAYNVLFRNQSLLSMVWNTSWALGDPFGKAVIAYTVQVLYLLFTVWIGLRILTRYRVPRPDAHARNRMLGDNLTDLVLLSMFISPLAWPHSYILLIPSLIWCYGTHTTRRRMILLAGALMMIPPVFELYPLSYHRFAGSILLLIAISPRSDVEGDGVGENTET